MEILLIRHSITASNLEKRYIGRTDEPLCEAGRALLSPVLAKVDALYCSPMLRCKESANLLFPNMKHIEVEDLRECDFGIFEGKNYIELDGNPEYQAWLDSQCTGQIPEGESLEIFSNRCVKSFAVAMQEALKQGCQRVAVVVHGGTIMALMAQWAKPEAPFYTWNVNNGCGFRLRISERWLQEGYAAWEKIEDVKGWSGQ